MKRSLVGEVQLDFRDAQAVSELFDRAAGSNLTSRLRKGGTVHLPRAGRLLMTGDLHDNRDNFEKIMKLAELESGGDRYLVLHEVIHGRHWVNGRDLSVLMLARVAGLILRWPGQVHLLLGNHDLSQLFGEGILKSGLNVVEAFDEGLKYIYEDNALRVREAMERLIRSLPLAVKCGNGLFCCHSLPSPHKLNGFDVTVVDRAVVEEDFAVNGPIYNMVWGRGHNNELAESLAKSWGVRRFLVGHQHAEMGYEVENKGQTILILASDHEHGVALPIDLSRDYSMNELVEGIVPLAYVSM
jgi:hypothetical protein